MNYILDDNHNPVPEPDILKWAQWIETAERHVALTELGELKVSTVFLGLDHNWSDGAPILFETLVFEYSEDALGPTPKGYPDWISCDDYPMRRYATWDEAQAGHDETVELVRATLALDADLADMLAGVKGL